MTDVIELFSLPSVGRQVIARMYQYGVAVKPCSSIRETICSDLDRSTDIPSEIVRDFPQFLQENSAIGHELFLPNLFQFIIYQLACLYKY
jgi:hypothetical protein